MAADTSTEDTSTKERQSVGNMQKSVVSLNATYSSPGTTAGTASKVFIHDLAIPVEEKSAYLAALRNSVSKLQDEVNVFLTQEMEREKSAAAATAAATDKLASRARIDEAKEADFYGEEVVDEEA
ncbi:MAG: hypothetical protein M1825_001091 [Sarcosagium campestre]|nr:MAG: hypothetical protein M1825_001091 [Sarcosagium campestre]